MSVVGIISSTDISATIKETLKLKGFKKIAVLCDSNTVLHCLPLTGLEQALLITIPAGEENKNFQSLLSVLEALTAMGADRDTVLLNLGGGMISDIGGLAASVFKRGIPFINVPTTLLGMVDAAIGGKNGIDFQNIKNHIGVFRQPESVLIASSFLDTLPEPEFRAGYAEMIKTAVMFDRTLFERLEAGEGVQGLIGTCAAIKQAVTERDFEDRAERKMLNFGHSIGHAIESYQLEIGKPILHGLAVGMGMLAELRLAVALEMMKPEEASRVSDLIRKSLKIEFDHHDQLTELLRYMAADKKNADGMIGFALPETIGRGKWNILINSDEIKNILGHE